MPRGSLGERACAAAPQSDDPHKVLVSKSPCEGDQGLGVFKDLLLGFRFFSWR